MCIVARQDKPNIKTCAGRRTTTRNTKCQCFGTNMAY